MLPRRLGAVVSAFDVRESAQADIASLGASVLDVGVTVASEGGYALLGLATNNLSIWGATFHPRITI